MSYRDAVMALNPVGYWRLGEASGTNAADETGANAGTYRNTPTLGVAGLLTGDANTAATFAAASSEDVLLRTGTPIIGGQVNHTIIAWIKDASTAAIRPLYSERPSTGNDIAELMINTTDGKIRANYRDDAGTLNQPVGTGVISGGPHMVAMTKTGTALAFFVDGAPAGTATLTISDNFTNANIQSRISSSANGVFLSATLDEVAVFNVALTPTQIADLYVSGTNTAPVFGQDLGNRSDAEGAVISLSAAATDADDDELTYSATGLPTGLSINASTGLISGTITAGAAASSPYSVEVSVTDDIADPVTDTFTWTVTAPEPEPEPEPEADGPTGALKAWRSW